eukprot:4586555-Pyramimonas_sp.AAC.1
MLVFAPALQLGGCLAALSDVALATAPRARCVRSSGSASHVTVEESALHPCPSAKASPWHSTRIISVVSSSD